MPGSHTLTLPQIRVADIEVLRPVKALEDHLPGYRYSATFLSSLRSNLHLSAASFPISPSSSLPATPISPAFPAQHSQVADGTCSAILKRRNPAKGPRNLMQDAPKGSPKSAAAVPVRSDEAKSSRGSQESPAKSEPRPKFTVLISDDIVGRIEALNLVSNSVAEQRWGAFVSIITNWTVLSLIIILLSLVFRVVSYAMFSALAATTVTTLLSGAWIATGEYKSYSNELDLGWLRASGRPSLATSTNPRSGASAQHRRNNSISSTASSSSSGSSTSSAAPPKINHGASSNNDPIIMVLRSAPASTTATSNSHQLPRPKFSQRQPCTTSTPRSHSQQQQLREPTIIGVVIMKYTKRTRTAHIRAWTIDRTHRGHGLGTELLEQSVRHIWSRGARSVEIDASHANSKRLQSLARLGLAWSRCIHFFQDHALQTLGGAAAAVALTEKSATTTMTASTTASRRRGSSTSSSSTANIFVNNSNSHKTDPEELHSRDMIGHTTAGNTTSPSSNTDTTTVSGDATLLSSQRRVWKAYGFPNFEKGLDEKEAIARGLLRDVVARVRREGGGKSR